MRCDESGRRQELKQRQQSNKKPLHRARALLLRVKTPDNREIVLRRMERAGAVLSSAEMAVYELLARSDGSAFKRLLPYLKDPR